MNLNEFFEEIGDHTFELRRIEGKRGQFVVGQKIQRQALLLKSIRPHTADFGQAVVNIAGCELHAQPAGFKSAVGQEILNKLLQPLSAGLHVAKDFLLAFAQWAKFLALQQLHVAIQDRQGRLKIMSCRAQGIGSALKTLTEFLVFL